MTLFETHAHIYDADYDADRQQVIERARQAGVETIILPATDRQSIEPIFELSAAYPGTCLPAVGLHPTCVNDNPDWEEDLHNVERLLKTPRAERLCAIGETGLDYYWSRDFERQQKAAFGHQIELSLGCGLPLIMHIRDAWDDALDIIRSFAGRGLRGVFHAYSGTARLAEELAQYGSFMFGIGGIVTFRKSTLADVVRQMPLERIVLETDCPYLTPEPHRGTRNEPAYIPYICSRVAQIKGVTPEQVADVTTRNARKLFLQEN